MTIYLLNEKNGFGCKCSHFVRHAHISGQRRCQQYHNKRFSFVHGDRKRGKHVIAQTQWGLLTEAVMDLIKVFKIKNIINTF